MGTEEKTEIKVLNRTKDFSNSEMVLIKGMGFFAEEGETAIGGSISANKVNGDNIDLDGKFEFEAPPGELKLEAKFIGYHFGTLLLSAQAGELIELEISFKSNSILLD